MKLTTLFLMALLLSAESKLTTEEKLSLARSEAAAATAEAALNYMLGRSTECVSFVAESRKQIPEMSEKAKAAREASAKLAADLKKKYGIEEACTFDETQEPKCPAKEVKK